MEAWYHMIESLKALLTDWQETRWITLEFINNLSDADLDKKLPRKHLNTIRLQAFELTLFQRDVIDSLPTNVLKYEDEYKYQNLTKQELIDKMAELDAKLEKALEPLNGTETYEYYGGQKNVHQVMSLLIGHEQMHIGQIIAFCYATGIEIPTSISEPMALEG